MPPPVKDPEAAWSVATPIEKYWLQNPHARLDEPLTPAQERALALLEKSGGLVNVSENREWAESTDSGWSVADHGTDIRARLVGAVLSEISSGSLLLFGYLVKDGVLEALSVPAQLDASILAEDFASPRALVYIAIGEPFVSGRVRCGSRTYTDIRVIPRETAVRLAAPKQQPARVQKRRGRKNMGSKIEPIIKRLIARDSGFPNLTRDQQCDAVRVERFGADVNHDAPPKDWRNGAIKTRLRALLPS